MRTVNSASNQDPDRARKSTKKVPRRNRSGTAFWRSNSAEFRRKLYVYVRRSRRQIFIQGQTNQKLHRL